MQPRKEREAQRRALMDDEDVALWRQNVGSEATGDNYWRMLAYFCEQEGLTPKALPSWFLFDPAKIQAIARTVCYCTKRSRVAHVTLAKASIFLSGSLADVQRSCLRVGDDVDAPLPQGVILVERLARETELLPNHSEFSVTGGPRHPHSPARRDLT